MAQFPITNGDGELKIYKTEFTNESGVNIAINICSALFSTLNLKMLANAAADTVRKEMMNV